MTLSPTGNARAATTLIPSVGRVVHYYRPVIAPGYGRRGPFVAHVTDTYIRPEGTDPDVVDLVYYDTDCMQWLAMHNVERSDEPNDHHWTWPPRTG